MRSPRRSAALLSAFSLIAAVGVGCGPKSTSSSPSGGTPSITLNGTDAVATINGQAVSQTEFFLQLQNYRPPQQSLGSPIPAGAAIMQQLIQAALQESLAKQQGVSPTDAQVDDEYNNFKLISNLQQTKDFEQSLTDNGLTPQEVKDWDLRPQVAQQNVMAKGQNVTDSDIKAYYDLNKAKPIQQQGFTAPERAHIKLFSFAAQADAKQVYDQVKTGQPFETFATRAVNKPSPDGDYPTWIPLDNGQDPRLAPLIKAIRSVKVGETTSPFDFNGSWQLVKVVEIKPKETLTLDETKSLIKNMILNQRMAQDAAASQQYQQLLRDAQTKADIQIKLPGTQYTSLLAQIKNPPPAAPPQPSLSGPAPSAPPPAPGKP